MTAIRVCFRYFLPFVRKVVGIVSLIEGAKTITRDYDGLVLRPEEKRDRAVKTLRDYYREAYGKVLPLTEAWIVIHIALWLRRKEERGDD